MDLDELRAELDEFAREKKLAGRSQVEERVLAGFEEIQRFVDEHGRAPLHGEDRDIFERLYAVRLDRLRALTEYHDLLTAKDYQQLLTGTARVDASALSVDELAEELREASVPSDITNLTHVRSRAEIQAAEEIADRSPCKDFADYSALFEQADRDLKASVRRTRTFGINPRIDAGDFFILNGQMAYVAEKGDVFSAPNGQPDARLRVIFANGTESDLLMRSLQRALYKDEAGRRLTRPDAGPLFGDELEDGDVESGTIYVLRSRSDHPFIVEHRDVIHKLGVTGGEVKARVADAANDPTYLLADVDVVATYKLAGINRVKLEALLHQIFAPAQLDLTIEDRFGRPVKPREWFLVPLAVIDEAVNRIMDGSIVEMVYDPVTARLVERT
jgi:hypothetical protein